MTKTSTMLEYERLSGEPSTQFITDGCHINGIETWHYKYVEWLEIHKAMSGEPVEQVGQACIGNCNNCSLPCKNRGTTAGGYSPLIY